MSKRFCPCGVYVDPGDEEHRFTKRHMEYLGWILELYLDSFCL